MFRRRDPEPEPPLVYRSGQVDTDLRDERDPDPVVEEATERLRQELGDLVATDQWGRPVAWRHVARISLGSLATPRVRDALTAEALAEAVQQQSVSPDEESPQWRALFRSVDERDRLLGS